MKKTLKLFSGFAIAGVLCGGIYAYTIENIKSADEIRFADVDETVVNFTAETSKFLDVDYTFVDLKTGVKYNHITNNNFKNGNIFKENIKSYKAKVKDGYIYFIEAIPPGPISVDYTEETLILKSIVSESENNILYTFENKKNGKYIVLNQEYVTNSNVATKIGAEYIAKVEKNLSKIEIVKENTN